jgi:hypothetical protein
MKAHDSMVIELEAPRFNSQTSQTRGDDLHKSPASAPARTDKLAKTQALAGAVIGRLAGLSESGIPLVHFTANPSGSPLPAALALPVNAADIGREAILFFEHGDPRKPILMGFLQSAMPPHPEKQPVEVRVDGEQLTFSAKNEIVLRCGKSSITLTRAGKVIIRGAYLLSRSSGANRIKGGSVQIN